MLNISRKNIKAFSNSQKVSFMTNLLNYDNNKKVELSKTKRKKSEIIINEMYYLLF